MKTCLWAAIVAAVATLGGSAFGQEAKSSSDNPASQRQRRESSADLAAIRAESKAFVDAFNRADAKAIALLWTENGDYTDETGRTVTGREAIAQEYAAFFKANSGAKIRLAIDSLKLLSDSAAIEDGRVILDPAPAGPPTNTRYVAIHVKVDGKWRMSAVRDSRIELPSAYHNLANLVWLIGTWTAEEHGTKTVSVCRWVANKSFVERTYTVTNLDHTTTSGVQLIGFSPEVARIQSWNFGPDGGHAIGIWTPRDKGWAAEIRGVTGDGTITTAVNLLTKLDDNAYVWQSVQRTAGGQPLPDTDEVVIRRSTAGR